jgi:hypothetical protein
VARWSQFEADAPPLAEVAARLWPGVTALARGVAPAAGAVVFPIAYLATVRPDGGPRLHPFCPIRAGDGLFASIPPSSPKRRDLTRDPRCVVHALPGPEDDELCIRARAVQVTDAARRDLVRDVVGRSGVGGMIASVASHVLFELDLQRVDVARWLDVGQAGTRAERRRWTAR